MGRGGKDKRGTDNESSKKKKKERKRKEQKNGTFISREVRDLSRQYRKGAHQMTQIPFLHNDDDYELYTGHGGCRSH